MKQCIRYLIDFKKVHDSVRREFLYNILFEFGMPATGKANKNASERNLKQSLCQQIFCLMCLLLRMV